MNRDHRDTAGTAKRLGGASLILAVAAGVVFVIPGAAEWLEYDRAALASGQMWRLVTCHWTHWSLDHLLWDVVAFVVLGVLCERSSPAAWLRCLMLAVVAIPAAVWLMLPQIEHYRGLSGVDSAFFLLLAAGMMSRQAAERRWIPLVAIVVLSAGFIAKIAYEALTGNAVFSDNLAAGFVAVPLAHLAGASAGILFAVRWKWGAKDRAVRSGQIGSGVERFSTQPLPHGRGSEWTRNSESLN